MRCAPEEPVSDGASARLTLECPRIPLRSLSAAQFRRRFMIPNLPVLLTDATDGWRAQREWVTPDGRPDLSALAQLFGDSIVPVANCARSGKRTEMSLAEYAAWWAGDRTDGGCLYLKDWTFAAEHPSYGAYETPAILRDDWLNQHWHSSRGGGVSGGADSPSGDGQGMDSISSGDGHATESISGGDMPAPGIGEGDSAAGDEAGDHRCAARSRPISPQPASPRAVQPLLPAAIHSPSRSAPACLQPPPPPLPPLGLLTPPLGPPSL